MKRRVAGFTIIEVIIALTILSMMMLAVITAMRTLGDTQVRVQKVVDRTSEMRMVSYFLREVVGQAIPIARKKVAWQKSTYFKGQESELIWVSAILAGPTKGGLTIARLSILDEQLLIQLQPYLPLDKEPKWGKVKSHLLVSNIKVLELAYRSNNSKAWEPSWEWQEKSPERVSISIETTERFWPEMIIALGNSTSQ